MTTSGRFLGEMGVAEAESKNITKKVVTKKSWVLGGEKLLFLISTSKSKSGKG